MITQPPAIPQRPSIPPQGASAAQRSAKASTIAEGLRIVGQNLEIITDDKLQLDGTITGNVFAEEIVVGPSGRVNGCVVAKRIEVHGTVSGAVYTAELVIGNTARVDGDVHYEKLKLDPSGLLEGTLRRLPDGSALPRPNVEKGTA